ncbi:MAG TPA: SDR family NAD(P)-dependent oxidoreductase [Leptolyngbyaceae cyanobacterium]
MAQVGLEVDYHQLDVNDDNSVSEFASFIKQKYSRLDILINNAGVNFSKQLEEGSILTAKIDTALSTFSVNTLGVLRICQALIPIMQERNYGRIVNVSTEMSSLSQLAIERYPLSPSYRLSKLGLNGLTCLLAKELKNTNILVNSYSPGWIKTDMGGADAPFTTEEGAQTAIYPFLVTLQEVKYKKGCV